jgi:tetratricopeptide (TPR) repeat protein
MSLGTGWARWILVAGLVVSAGLLAYYCLRTPAPGPSASRSSPANQPGERSLAGGGSPVPLASILPDSRSPAPTAPAAILKEANKIGNWLVRCFPENPDALEVMSRVHYWLGDASEATKYWEKCLKLDRGYLHAYFGLGRLAADKGDFRQAAALFRKTMELNPASLAPRIELANALTQLGQAEEAIAVLKRSVPESPDAAEVLSLLGAAHLQRKEYQEAKACYEGAVAIDPHPAKAHLGLATVYSRLGEAGKAAAHAAKFREMGPETTRRRYSRDDHDDLEGMCRDLARICVAAGQVCEGANRPRDAERLWRRAIVVAPAELEARELLARLLLKEE